MMAVRNFCARFGGAGGMLSDDASVDTDAGPFTTIAVHYSVFRFQILLAENWNESNTLLGTTGPHYFIHYKGWKQT